VELAEQFGAPLITTDRRLASTYPQAQVPPEVIDVARLDPDVGGNAECGHR
jgi:hypothetical protein